MATYTHTLNLGANGQYGTVKFNMSPAPGTPMGVGDTIQISGSILWKNYVPRYVTFTLHRSGASSRVSILRKAISGGGVNVAATFSLTVKLTSAMIGQLTSSAMVDALVGFTVESPTGAYTRDTVADSSIKYQVFGARAYPTASVALSDRHAVIVDGQRPLEYFGGLVQGQSLPRLTADVTWDSRDTKLTISHQLRILDGSAVIYKSTAPSGQSMHAGYGTVRFDVGALDVAGTLTWEYTITDSAGLWRMVTGTMTVLPYAPPSLTAFAVERYRTVVGEGAVPSPSGDHVMLTIAGAVAQVAAKNGWTLTLRWGEAGGTTADVQIAADDDGGTLAWTRDTTLFTAQVPASAAYDFELILTDLLGQASALGSVTKGTCYLDVETHGIGIGMYVSGDASDKRVEIADDYALMPYGDVLIPENKLLKVVTVTASGTMSTSTTTMSKTIAVNAGAGWTPIGVVGFRASSSWCAVYRAQLDSGSVEMACRYHGTSSSGTTVTLTADVLCLHTAIQ